VVAAYCVVQGVAAVPGRRRLGIRRIRRAQTRVRVLAAVCRKVLAEEVRQPLVEASARLGSRAADGGLAGQRRPPVVLEREAHAVLAAAGAGPRKAGRQLGEVFVGVVVEAAPGAVRGHGRAVAARRPGRRVGRGARRRGRIPRYRRHSPARRLQYSQLFPVVAEARLRRVPVGGLARSVCGVFRGRSWRDGAGRDVALLFAAASRR
jgi:hypothetical protein